MIDIKDKLDIGANARDQGKFDLSVRNAYMNASEAATCIRKQWYKVNGRKPDQKQSWGFARRGQAVEEYVIDRLKAANVLILYSGKDQTGTRDDSLRLSATVDGIVVEEGDTYALEIKSIDPRTNKTNLPRPEHVEQIKIGMHLLALDKGLLVYVNASDFDDITQFEVDALDHDFIAHYAARAKRLFGTRSVDSLDREGKSAGGRECRTCAYAGACGVSLGDVSHATAKANRGSSLHSLASRVLEIKGEQDALDAERAEAQEGIKADLKKRDLTSVTMIDLDISLQIVKGRTSLDTKAAERAGIDLSPFQKTGAPSERLTVTRKE